eukprot:scaffold4817_cov107-Cylindrotheca_fusiformis.AAC.5
MQSIWERWGDRHNGGGQKRYKRGNCAVTVLEVAGSKGVASDVDLGLPGEWFLVGESILVTLNMLRVEVGRGKQS